jgi:hypothetical protein
MILSVGQSIQLRTIRPAAIVSMNYCTTLRSPVRAYPDQDITPLTRGMQAASLGIGNDRVVTPPLNLNLYTLDKGVFFVGHGLDGAILMEDGRPIHQTAQFCEVETAGKLQDTVLDLPDPVELDEVFVGFDGAWRNYFHWLCFAIPKSFMAARYLDNAIPIAVPDYGRLIGQRGISYTAATWEQSLSFSGLSGRVMKLPQGAYRARKLHFLWTSSHWPTDIMYSTGFTDAFDAVARHVGRPAKPIDNVYLARSAAVTNRLEAQTEAVLAAVLERNGFATVRFENCDLATQIATIANAKRVVSPHGAGLANTLFHRGGLKMLELNKDLDGKTAFRAWFYVAAGLRKHRYAMLDSTMPDFRADHVEAALAALDK